MSYEQAHRCFSFFKYIFSGFFAFNVQDSGDRQETGGRERGNDTQDKIARLGIPDHLCLGPPKA